MNDKRKNVALKDHEIMVFIMDNYGPGLNNPSALIRHLRKNDGLSCSEERFRTQFYRYLREYNPEELKLKDNNAAN